MTEEKRKSPIFQNLLHFYFNSEYNRKAFEGDEIAIKHLRYRLTEYGWVLVIKPSAESGDEIKQEQININEAYNSPIISPYMKQLNITLQEAKELWKSINDFIKENKHSTLFHSQIKDMILKTWTQEELEEKQGYTWEESFSGEGWFLGLDGCIHKEGVLTSSFQNKIYFKTKEQAESALAFAQLSHITDKYNGCKDGPRLYSVVPDTHTGQLKITDVLNVHAYKGIVFVDESDAKVSMKTNRQLWIDYWQLNHLKDKK